MTWLSRLLPQSPSLQRVADRNNRTRQSQRRRRQATLESLEDRTLLSNVLLTYTTNPVNGAVTLNILGDTLKDKFTVQENNVAAGGTVTVTGSTSSPVTTINGALSQTTLKQITNINITLPGNKNDTDYVTILGPATGHSAVANINVVVPGASTTVAGTELHLTVTNVQNTGAFNVYDAPTSTSAVSPDNPLPTFQPGFAPGSTYTQAGYSQPGGGYLFPIDPSTSEPIYNQLGGVLSATVTGSSFGSATIEQ